MAKQVSPRRCVSYHAQWDIGRRILALQRNGWQLVPQLMSGEACFCARFFRVGRVFELFVEKNDSQTAFLSGAEYQKPLKAIFDLGIVN